jgi:F-box and WD-40 domain protein CDC4
MKLHSTYAIPGEGVVSSFHSTTTYILIGLDDGKIHIFDSNGGYVRTLVEPTGSVWGLAAFENKLLSGGTDGSVRVWDIISGFVFKAKLSASDIEDLAALVTS